MFSPNLRDILPHLPQPRLIGRNCRQSCFFPFFLIRRRRAMPDSPSSRRRRFQQRVDKTSKYLSDIGLLLARSLPIIFSYYPDRQTNSPVLLPLTNVELFPSHKRQSRPGMVTGVKNRHELLLLRSNTFQLLFSLTSTLQYQGSQVRPPAQCRGKGLIQRTGKSDKYKRKQKISIPSGPPSPSVVGTRCALKCESLDPRITSQSFFAPLIFSVTTVAAAVGTFAQRTIIVFAAAADVAITALH